MKCAVSGAFNKSKCVIFIVKGSVNIVEGSLKGAVYDRQSLLRRNLQKLKVLQSFSQQNDFLRGSSGREINAM